LNLSNRLMYVFGALTRTSMIAFFTFEFIINLINNSVSLYFNYNLVIFCWTQIKWKTIYLCFWQTITGVKLITRRIKLVNLKNIYAIISHKSLNVYHVHKFEYKNDKDNCLFRPDQNTFKSKSKQLWRKSNLFEW